MKIAWDKVLDSLDVLVQRSPEENRLALYDFLAAAEKARTDDSLDAAKALWWIAAVVDQRMNAKQAELLYVLALLKMEHYLGNKDPMLAGVLHSLANYLVSQEQAGKAEQYYQRILDILEHNPECAEDMLIAVREYLGLLEAQNRMEEAQALRSLEQNIAA